MSTKRSDIDLALQDRLSSTSNIKTDTLSRQRTMNRVLQEMQLYANWLWTIRETTFDYYRETEEYTMATLAITDFKDVFKIEGQSLHNPQHLEQGIAKKMIDGDYILMLDLGISDKTDVDLEYFSTNMVKDDDGTTLKTAFENTNDTFLGPDDVVSLIIEWCMVELYRNIKKIDKEVIAAANSKMEELRDQAFKKYGFTISKGKKPINIAR